jgi:iron complex outermembrane receptor protein
VKLSERLSGIAGARYDRQMYLSEMLPAGAKTTSSTDQLTLDHITPKAALLYRAATNHSLYLSVSGGVESPAFNEVDPPSNLSGVQLNPFLKPMSSTTVELGMKGYEVVRDHPIIRSLLYSFAAYRITIQNEIVPYDGGLWFFSAGKSRRYGVEMNARVDLAGDLSASAALTYLDAEYTTYSNELGDFAGRKVPGIPPIVLHARLRYSSPVHLTADLGAEHIASYYADDANSVKVPSYLILNAAAGYSLRLGSIGAQAFVGVNNLTDQKHASSAFINPATRSGSGAAIAPAYLEPGLPRNFFASLDLRLDL